MTIDGYLAELERELRRRRAPRARLLVGGSLNVEAVRATDLGGCAATRWLIARAGVEADDRGRWPSSTRAMERFRKGEVSARGAPTYFGGGVLLWGRVGRSAAMSMWSAPSPRTPLVDRTT
jgi:hypothetical protein